MDEVRCKAVLRMMKVGERITESWLLRQHGVSLSAVDVLVEMGYLIKYPKVPNDFMSDTCYSLTLHGREYAWR